MDELNYIYHNEAFHKKESDVFGLLAQKPPFHFIFSDNNPNPKSTNE